MKRSKRPDRILKRPRKHGPLTAPRLGLALLFFTLPLLTYLAWPYATLWRIDRALRNDDSAALVELVDLGAVRGAIKTKLNKEADSDIGEFSDAFIHWLQEGIEVGRNRAVEYLVTLDWICARLLEQGATDNEEGFLGRISYAFFDAPDRFFVRIGEETDRQIYVHLKMSGLSWRLSALYY